MMTATIMMTMSLMASLLFMLLNHPMAMGFTLLVQTTIIAMLTGLTTQSYWFSYILFLIFMGGMMVLFIYVASLSPNEMFSLTSPLLIPMTIVPTILLLITLMDPMTMSNMMNFTETNLATVMPSLDMAITKIYTTNLATLMVIMISYLFLTLIVVVKITNLWMGPLRLKK